MSKSGKILITATICILFIVGIYQLIRPSKPIQIGFVAGLSGKFADLGIDCRRGVEMAIRTVNNDGGINGHSIEMIAMDDGQNQAMAIKAVEAMIKQKIPVIIGHSTSSMTMASLPLINKGNTLLVSPTSSTSRLANIDDNFLRSCTISTTAAARMANYLVVELGYKAIGIIYDLSNEAYTTNWSSAFKDSFYAHGGQTLESLSFSSEPDFSFVPLVRKMRRTPLESLVLVTNSVDAAMLCQQIRKSGWDVPIALADWAATEQLINMGGEAVEGVVFQQFFNRKSQKADYLRFKKAFVELYKSEPGFGAVHAHNAASMVFRSMREQRKDETLKQAILRISTFKGLQNNIEINRYGDAEHPTFMGVVRNGELVLFEGAQ